MLPPMSASMLTLVAAGLKNKVWRVMGLDKIKWPNDGTTEKDMRNPYGR